MYQDKIIRFLGAAREWTETSFENLSLNLSLSTLIGDSKDCIIVNRECDIDEMQTEEDERYVFSLPDYSVVERFNRFETRRVFAKLNKDFNENKIDLILRMAWNYPKVVINTKTTEFNPYADKHSNLPPMPPSGGPPVRQKIID